MMKKILLDTDIAIWLLKKSESHVETLLKAQQQNYKCLLSPIVSAEIYAGAFKHEYEMIEGLFNLLQPLSLTIETGKVAGEFANQYHKAYNKISLEDYVLAATAFHENAWLWTGNTKHYPMPEARLFSTELLSDH